MRRVVAAIALALACCGVVHALQVAPQFESKDQACQRVFGPNWGYNEWPNNGCSGFNCIPCATIPFASAGTTSAEMYCPISFSPPKWSSNTPASQAICTGEGTIVPKSVGDACPRCGNPVNPAIGNKFAREADYLGAGAFPLKLERWYNSASIEPSDTGTGRALTPGIFGDPWRSTYERRIVLPSELTAIVTAYAKRPDGKTHFFNRVNGVFVAEADVPDRLERLVGGTGQPTGWRFTAADGDLVETYDVAGALVSIANRAGLTQALSYDGAGRLVEIADSFGRRLVLAYDAQGRVATMTDPNGGVYAYA